MDNRDTSVKVAVRIRPLNQDENHAESSLCLDINSEESQIIAGTDNLFTFDYVFGIDSSQDLIYKDCVTTLVDAFFEGFNATILAYGQTGSGKTWTMGSSSDMNMIQYNIGIIPRVIKNLFQEVRQRETDHPTSSYKIHVQFLEIYGEDIRDLLDQTKTSNVTIRETREDGVFVSGAKEELVSSYEQMMKTLEDGTRHRTTASTRMNQTSSRSHDAVVVDNDFIETTIPNNTNNNYNNNNTIKPTTTIHTEVRKSKFHFVDLAGSERAKRTGAVGQQLKEGIDINKGLLALGNVISALGDDTKRGKAFVPYRDSKLTRMLQDSLGGNSKTLMICCVSPSPLNFNESVNALRYANRARNIKNKPIVNRDPTLLMIDELKQLLYSTSSELLEIRKAKRFIVVDDPVPIDILENWALLSQNHNNKTMNSNSNIKLTNTKVSIQYQCDITSPTSSNSQTTNKNIRNSMVITNATNNEEIIALKSQLRDADEEIQRLLNNLKTSKLQVSEVNEYLILANSERDFYRMKWSEACPSEATLMEIQTEADVLLKNSYDLDNICNDTNSLKEKKFITNIISKHLREVDTLKKELAEEKAKNASKLATITNDSDTVLDAEFTNSISNLLTQTREQLRIESQLLKNGIDGVVTTEEEEDNYIATDDHLKSYYENINDDNNYLKRQKNLTNEVVDLGQSIYLKEQLMVQLVRSQQQYGKMKTYYEDRLAVLNIEMKEKQQERDRLLNELHEVADEKNEALVQKEAREKRLRDDLKRKDEELKNMKKKQDELNRLSQIQTNYSNQLVKLETDVISMKKQRIDLLKTLQIEKKTHLSTLAEKAKEIEKLKRELSKSTIELKKLGRDKEIAEIKAKDAVKDGLVLRKKAQDILRSSTGVNATLSGTRAAYKAMSKISQISSTLTGTKRIFTEEELRTKKWIDKRIEEISAREAAAEALKAQYEHQLELLNRKQSLELEKNAALSNKQDLKDDSNEMNVIDDNNINPKLLLSDNERGKLLEIEEQLSLIDGQLDEKHLQISDIAHQIASAGDVTSSERTMEVLKRTAAGSLPASHELIRLLFDMLLQSSRSIKCRWDEVHEHRDRIELLKQEIQELQEHLTSEKRAHDIEVTQTANEYEEKLHDLFTQFSLVSNNDQDKNTLSSLVPTSYDGNSLSIISGKDLAMMDPLMMQLAVSTEENKFLRSQVGREGTRLAQLQLKYTELDRMKNKLIRENNDKNDQIKFLEEDRSLFKTLADDLKSGLLSIGKPGKNILESVKHRHTHGINSSSSNSSSSNNMKIGGGGRGLFNEYYTNNLNDHEDEDDDTESIENEFNLLAEEIFKTGTIPISKNQIKINNNNVNNNNNSNNNNENTNSNILISPKSNTYASITNNSGNKTIYDRLTNPSNFTGHMKNVFENDLEFKRKKIQQIRTDKSKADKINSNSIYLQNLMNSNYSNNNNNNNSFNKKNISDNHHSSSNLFFTNTGNNKDKAIDALDIDTELYDINENINSTNDHEHIFTTTSSSTTRIRSNSNSSIDLTNELLTPVPSNRRASLGTILPPKPPSSTTNNNNHNNINAISSQIAINSTTPTNDPWRPV